MGFSMKVKKFEEDIVKVVNECELPACVIGMVLASIKIKVDVLTSQAIKEEMEAENGKSVQSD